MPGWQTINRSSSLRMDEKDNTSEFLSGADLKEYGAHLLRFGQTLYRQRKGVINLLCQEVARISHGYLKLLPRRDNEVMPVTCSPSIPVQFQQRLYGALLFQRDIEVSRKLTIGDVLDFARDCGSVIFTLEHCLLPQGDGRVRDVQYPDNLTRREKEILKLMVRGYDEESIARALDITVATVSKHRHTLYEKLGVHNSHDAILVGYHTLCFSPLEDIMPCSSNIGYEVEYREKIPAGLPDYW
ncbi:MAG TPA: helix-turn-helix transcriptional regulator [Ktedonobacteraceae bacterium]|nr:helix-turn-helix transcriptional regulator [Ktedonobacteraceae bacterium]